MRSRPAHISRDHRVDELPVRSPRRRERPAHASLSFACDLTNLTPYQLCKPGALPSKMRFATSVRLKDVGARTARRRPRALRKWSHLRSDSPWPPALAGAPAEVGSGER